MGDKTVEYPPEIEPYVKRHIVARHGDACFDDSYGAEDRARWLGMFLEIRQDLGLKNLATTTQRLPFTLSSVNDLILGLSALPTDGSAPIIVSELIDRGSMLDSASKDRLLDALLDLATEIQPSPTKRAVADRALMRLLYKLDRPLAFSIAAICAGSPRTIRRNTSYRFYLHQGIDDAGREILADTIWDNNLGYCKAITIDPALVRRIGLARVLMLAPNSYWRKTAIKGALPGDTYGLLEVCRDYPLELVWAINEARMTSLGSHVVSLLERHKDDAYLLNRIVQCLTRLGDAESIALSMRRAAELLTRSEDYGDHLGPHATPRDEQLARQ